MAALRSTLPWYQAAAELCKRQEGRTAVEVLCRPVMIDPGDGSAICSSTSLWRGCAEQVFSVATDGAGDGPAASRPAADGNAPLVAEGAIDFLQNCDRPIDLLYLDGWAIGTAGYQERHLQAYDAARCRFHDRTVILVGDTARDHGGKAALVLPRALEDGFQILLWGDLLLLGRVRPAAVRDIVPRIGPPVPAEASLDDAIRMHREGWLWEAEQLYRDILKQWPDHIAALHLLGVVRYQRGDFAKALELIGKAIALDPAKSTFFNNFGAALQGLGRCVEALACFHRALQLQPEYADALSNLGLAQGSLGQDQAARDSFCRALELQPQHLDTVKRLGELLQKQGQDAQAIDLYRKAIGDKPQPELCLQLGNLLSLSGRTDLAAAEYQKAIDVRPELAEAWFNKGVAYQDQRMIPEARECFDRAVQLRPERPLWRLRREGVGPLVFQSNAEIAAYRADLARALAAWLAAPPPRANWNDLLFADALPVFNLAYHGGNNRALKETLAAVFAPYFRDVPEPAGSGMAARRRIGGVVTARHEGIFLRCMKGIWERLNRDDFEVVIFCSGAALQRLRAEIRRDDLRFVALPCSLPQVVQTIRSAACDLIYHWEVGSDSLNYLMPFARLAPVQCTSHGSLVTSGVPAVQYFLSSELTETAAAADHYSEKLWKAKTLLMYQSRLPAVSPVSRDYFRLPEDRRLYMCLQNPLKLHPDIDPLLGGILAADPKGLVVLLGGRHERVVTLLKQRFAETIPADGQRIVLLPWLKFDDYCRLLRLADVVLDPPHYTAGSSVYDMFSFDQPIITMEGELAVSRVTAAYYRKMGIGELIAPSAEAYVRLAVAVAGDRDYRMNLRERIHLAGGAIFDDLEAVREHERFFHEVLA